jgi:hypothetical protein
LFCRDIILVYSRLSLTVCFNLKKRKKTDYGYLNNNDDNLANLPLYYVLIIKYMVLSLPDFDGFDRAVGTYMHKIKREIIMTVKLLVTISSCYRTRNVCKTFQIAQCATTWIK